jgi:hypothetical protein
MGYDPALGSRFDVDAEDLRANTDGRLSDEQERMLAAAAAAMGRHERRTRVLLVVVRRPHRRRAAAGQALTGGARYRVHHLDSPDGAVPSRSSGWTDRSPAPPRGEGATIRTTVGPA